MKRYWNLDEIIVSHSKKLSTWTISERQNEPQLPFSNAEMVYEAGRNASKVWALDDDTFCKSKLLILGTTREHVTLEYLQKHSLGFEVPRVLHYKEYNGRYYIILSRVSGSTLEEAWPTMEDTDKNFCVDRVVEICEKMASWGAGSTICGVDGNNLPDQFLAAAKIGPITTDDLRPSTLLKNCEDIGLECSSLMFYHCDLGPGNIMVDLEKKTIGIIDWECAGWVPKGWVRTKFRISGGMDLDFEEEQDRRIEWRKRVQMKLGEREFPEASEKWFTWRRLHLDRIDLSTVE